MLIIRTHPHVYCATMGGWVRPAHPGSEATDMSAQTYHQLKAAGAPALPDGWAYRIEQTSDGDRPWLSLKVAVVEVGRRRDVVIHEQDFDVYNDGTIRLDYGWIGAGDDPRKLRDGEPGAPEENVAAACEHVVGYIKRRQQDEAKGRELTTGYRGLLGRHP